MTDRSLRLAPQVPMLLTGLFFGVRLFAGIDLPLLQKSNPDIDWEDLARGEVVWRAFPDDEIEKAELVGMVAVRVRADVEAVLEQLNQGQPGVVSVLLDARSDASVRESFDGYSLRREQTAYLDWFSDPEPDGTFNAGRVELEKMQAVVTKAREAGADQAQTRGAMEVAVRDILAARVNEYRNGGLAAISPYDVDGKQIYPGDYLASSMRSMELLAEEEPDFYRAFVDYPKAQTQHYDHQFVVTTETESNSGRPLTSLKHWMVERRDGFTLIGERKFYISHSLDAMHTLILLLEEGDQCYVFLLNQSFTQKVTGFGSFIAHKVGRSKVKENILPLFDNLKAAFQ
jgi:hypothetical protein